MKILMASSEAVPYCKTGGLADVVGALSEELGRKGHSVALVLPLYQSIAKKFPSLIPIDKAFQVPLWRVMQLVKVSAIDLRENVRVYFVQYDRFFDRPSLYGEGGTAYSDNDARFILFSRSVLELAKAVNFRPDVIHCHDWQTGLVPAYLKTLYNKDPFFSSSGSAFTIHNMAYQGVFPRPAFDGVGLPGSEFHPQKLEFYGQVSFLKGGLVYSDAVNTVSPTYAKEIQNDPQFGMGLEGVLQERADRFRGILNGIDPGLWNPSTDRFLAKKFDRKNLSARASCKKDLQKAAGLRASATTPVLGFVGRLDDQKGIDILLNISPVLLRDGVQMVFLGQGQPQYAHALQALRNRFPSQVFVEGAFAESFAHKIYGGADLFLMPSRYEPCGLGQLIAMRYGAVPVVTPTGGLLDTVIPSSSKKPGTGFVAEHVTPGAFLSTVKEALSVYSSKTVWQKIQLKGMAADYSWSNSLDSYLEMYKSAVWWSRAHR